MLCVLRLRHARHARRATAAAVRALSSTSPGGNRRSQRLRTSRSSVWERVRRECLLTLRAARDVFRWDAPPVLAEDRLRDATALFLFDRPVHTGQHGEGGEDEDGELLWEERWAVVTDQGVGGQSDAQVEVRLADAEPDYDDEEDDDEEAEAEEGGDGEDTQAEGEKGGRDEDKWNHYETTVGEELTGRLPAPVRYLRFAGQLAARGRFAGEEQVRPMLAVRAPKESFPIDLSQTRGLELRVRGGGAPLWLFLKTVSFAPTELFQVQIPQLHPRKWQIVHVPWGAFISTVAGKKSAYKRKLDIIKYERLGFRFQDNPTGGPVFLDIASIAAIDNMDDYVASKTTPSIIVKNDFLRSRHHKIGQVTPPRPKGGVQSWIYDMLHKKEKTKPAMGPGPEGGKGGGGA